MECTGQRPVLTTRRSQKGSSAVKLKTSV
jgi:hypothetical protein